MSLKPNSTICEECADDDTAPCCNRFNCEAMPGARETTLCIHCYGELIEVNKFWYHHTQFNENGTLMSPDNPQDVVT